MDDITYRPKDRIHDSKKNGVVYIITCGLRNKLYIGKTGRTLEMD